MRKIKIAGDGSVSRTKLFDAITGERLSLVKKFQISLDIESESRLGGSIEYSTPDKEPEFVEIVSMTIERGNMTEEQRDAAAAAMDTALGLTPFTFCKGIDLGDGNFSGCDHSHNDCPHCGK